MPIEEKPSRNEDEYFAKQDAERIKEMRARLDAERAQTERKSRLGRCPKCGENLVEKEFHHVKIDLCPDCGGMWLDKGEWDMIKYVDRNAVSRFVGSMFGLKGK